MRKRTRISFVTEPLREEAAGRSLVRGHHMRKPTVCTALASASGKEETALPLPKRRQCSALHLVPTAVRRDAVQPAAGKGRVRTLFLADAKVHPLFRPGFSKRARLSVGYCSDPLYAGS